MLANKTGLAVQQEIEAPPGLSKEQQGDRNNLITDELCSTAAPSPALFPVTPPMYPSEVLPERSESDMSGLPEGVWEDPESSDEEGRFGLADAVRRFTLATARYCPPKTPESNKATRKTEQ
mmetsp:Transcript_24541/g.47723  ORF Transcript_24541/g.47723 Transcript_24541/m.47723 type:complete len:121 (+) Transcript_24541:88-450(+)